MGSYAVTAGTVRVKDCPEVQAIVQELERLAADMDEGLLTVGPADPDEYGPDVLEITVNVAGYSSATHACEIDDKVGQLGLHAVEGARFDSEWEDQKEPLYVGNDKQAAEAKSRDALARIRELLPELKMDKAEAALAILFDLEDADPGAAVTDVLADVRHFCDRHGLCFGDLDRAAYGHYLEELRGRTSSDRR